MFLRNLLFSALLLGSAPALASSGMCPSQSDRVHFSHFRDRIAGADTPEAARKMALDQTRLGHRAIRQAASVLPESADIATAEARLTAFDDGVAAAGTQEEVAQQLDLLVDSQAMSAGNCDYTTTEVVIIVIGFILGILPGILFLFLFC